MTRGNLIPALSHGLRPSGKGARSTYHAIVTERRLFIFLAAPSCHGVPGSSKLTYDIALIFSCPNVARKNMQIFHQHRSIMRDRRATHAAANKNEHALERDQP
jgi:hypothetical protein